MSTVTAQPQTLDTLLESLSPETVPALPLSGICLDSRLVEPGDVYLALAGGSTHGMRFASQAVDSGAVAVLTTPDAIGAYAEAVYQLQQAGIPVLGIADLDKQCASLAAKFYDHPDRDMTLIAVTGTDGKTSVCRFIAQALSVLDHSCGYIGTLGWGFGEELQANALTTPDAVTLRRMLASMKAQGARCIALEASSHGLAEGRLDGLELDVAVLTNLGRDHLDYHRTVEAYRDAKAQLFKWPGLSAVVLNGRDALGQDLIELTAAHKRFVYTSDNAHIIGKPVDIVSIHADDIATHDHGLEFSIHERVNEGAGELTDAGAVSTALLGRFNVDNLLACYGSLRACGIAANEARHSLQSLKPVTGRMERFAANDSPTVVVDFAHTPQALSVAIDAVRVHCKGRLWVVFGCGGDRDRGKRAPMAAAAEAADHVVLTDDNPRSERSEDIIADALRGFSDPQAVTVISDRAAAIAHAVHAAAADDLVLIAGKGHEEHQTIGSTRHHFSDREQVMAALEHAS